MNIWDRNGIIIALLWLIPAATMFWTVWSNRRGVPMPVRLGMGRGMLVLSAVFFGGGIHAAWITPRRLHAADYAALGSWLMQVVLWVWLCGYISAKLSMERGEQVKRRRNGGSFFWQAIFILLPVIGLACFGIYSMRQDRLIAEQEARETGASLARRLTEIFADSSGAAGTFQRQLYDYYNANFELDAMRTTRLGLSGGWAGGQPDQEAAQRRITTWESANREMDLPSQPLVAGFLKFQKEARLPRPPAWLEQLSPEQQKLWQSAQESEFVSRDFPAAQSAIEKFIATKPPAGAEAEADYVLLLIKTRGLEGAQASEQFFNSKWDRSDLLTDAGLPVGQLICCRGLQLMPEGAGITQERLNQVAWAIAYRPSIFSRNVVVEAERVAKGTPSEADVATLRDWWEANEAQREVLEDFEDEHPTNTWADGKFWVDSDAGSFLLLLGDALSFPTTNNPEPAQLGCRFALFPEPVIRKALLSSVNNADLPIPPYALVQFEMAGHLMALPPNESLSTASSEMPVLGQTDGTLKMLPAADKGYPFQVRVLLASPEILYQREKQRMLLFGGLIVASAFGALIALLAAYRSFRRQLALNEMKSDFVSSVSHELRAPIASVRLMAEGLERGKIQEPGKQREYFKFIVQECRRLSSLIENVLDFSRIEEGRKRYEMESTDLVALAEQTVKVMATYATERQVELALQVSGKAAPVNADGKALQQALVNLIDNAIKHSPKGTKVKVGLGFGAEDTADAGSPHSARPMSAEENRRDGHLTPALSPSEAEREKTDSVRLSVEDQGEGIPASEHEKIFERFYRVGSELRRETHGVGIGLSIVKHIVEAHGGKVTVQSAPGRGSTFTIELPIGTNGAGGQEH
jgi:signal transduction histidine kinase